MKIGENIKFGERNPLPIGSKFNKLTTLEEATSVLIKHGYHKITKNPIYTPIYHYKCQCECGEIKIIQKRHIVKNIATSCGCNKWGKKVYKTLPRWLVRMAKSNADVRNIKWDIDLEYLGDLFEHQNGKCAYTGWDLIFPHSKKPKTASIDRIDSSRGYVRGNVQWVHKNVNIAKNALKHNEFLELCKAVVKKEHLKELF
jgi:hypothetical protein